MDYRTGKCSQCGAEYKIPASFAHNVARCKLCKGVVHLGAAPAGSAQPRAPARPESAPSSAPRRERPEPARAAAETRPQPPPPPPPRQPIPERRPAEAAPPDHGRTIAASAPAVRTAPPRPRRRVAALLFLTALVLAAAGFFLYRALAGGRAAALHGREPTGEDARPAPERPAGDPAAGSDSEEQREKSTPDTGASVPAPDATVLAPAVALERIPDFDPTPDTGAEEWTRMVQGTAAWLAADDGEAADRERTQLVAQGRKAVPALLNAFKRQDFSTPAGLRACERCRAALAEISNGATPGGTGGGDAACRQAAAAWAAAWGKTVESIDEWIALARLEQEDPEEAHRLREQFGGLGPAEEPLEDE